MAGAQQYNAQIRKPHGRYKGLLINNIYVRLYP